MPTARCAPATRRVATLLLAVGLAATLAAAADFDTPAHLVILTAVADGHPVRLLLDTGDPGGLSLDAAAAERLGLAIAPAPASLPAPGGADRGLAGPLPPPVGTTRIGRLAIETAGWRGIEALVIREDPALVRAVGAPYDGVIGAALLAGRRLIIDYPLREVTFVAASPAASDGGPDRGAKLQLEAGRLLTEIDLGRGPRPAIIDTASAATFIDTGAAAAWRAIPGSVRGIVDAGGLAAGLPAAQFEMVGAGGAILREVAALTLDPGDVAGRRPRGMPPPAAIIGADLLARHRVILDLVAGRFVLEGGRP